MRSSHLKALGHEELLGGRLGGLTTAVALADEGCGSSGFILTLTMAHCSHASWLQQTK